MLLVELEVVPQRGGAARPHRQGPSRINGAHHLRRGDTAEAEQRLKEEMDALWVLRRQLWELRVSEGA
jgi:hypothetical protein